MLYVYLCLLLTNKVILIQLKSAENNGADKATGRNINLNSKTLINPSDDTALGKEDKNLPGWSEKMSQSITAGLQP